MVQDNHTQSTRRNVIRGTLTGLGITALPALASTSRAADDDFVLRDGELQYTGSTDARTAEAGPLPLDRAVAGLNAAADRGLVSYNLQDGDVFVRPTRKNEHTVSLLAGCPGKIGYNNRWTWQGMRHIFRFDDCTTNELRNKLIADAALSEISAVVAGATGNAPRPPSLLLQASSWVPVRRSST